MHNSPHIQRAQSNLLCTNTQLIVIVAHRGDDIIADFVHFQTVFVNKWKQEFTHDYVTIQGRPGAKHET